MNLNPIFRNFFGIAALAALCGCGLIGKKPAFKGKAFGEVDKINAVHSIDLAKLDFQSATSKYLGKIITITDIKAADFVVYDSSSGNAHCAIAFVDKNSQLSRPRILAYIDVYTPPEIITKRMRDFGAELDSSKLLPAEKIYNGYLNPCHGRLLTTCSSNPKTDTKNPCPFDPDNLFISGQVYQIIKDDGEKKVYLLMQMTSISN